MAETCCQKKCDDLGILARSQRTVLWAVLLINAVMFGVEFYSGWISHSLSLSADSLDMLGDALAYGSSLWAVGLGVREKARAALFKAQLMMGLGLLVLANAVYRFYTQTLPSYEWMLSVGLVALGANLFCLYLLSRHRNDDLNFRSVWICSRNDIIANSSVLLAAFAVLRLESHWPDLLVGLVITYLFIRSAYPILVEARQELRV